MSLLNRIEKIIKEKGYTLAFLERELGFGNGAIRRWDTSSPSCDKLLKLANFLNISTDYLLCNSEELSVSDKELLKAYHSKPEMQEAVNKLLGLGKAQSAPFKGRLVAKGGLNLGTPDDEDEPRHT